MRDMLDSAVMRPLHGNRIGTTRFFRNRAFLKTLVRILRGIPHPRVLNHGCSNGAEAYSLAMAWCEEGGSDAIEIHATDIERSFLEQTSALTHPRLTPRARKLVTFLPPASVTEFRSKNFYDVTICNNVLCYLAPEEQREAIARMADYTARYLCITAGEPAIMRQAIRDAGFRPCSKNWFAIYWGWKERLSFGHRKVWKLPYLPLLLPHWHYAGTTIFQR